MANTIEVSDDLTEILKLLQSYIQSGNINFLIGSGASMPAIQTAGNIEGEINDLMIAGDNAAADLKALEFIESIEDKNIAISIGIEDAETAQTLTAYGDFITAVDRLLFERKNLLLPRQANVFTTNYDTLLEHSASKIPSLILNDGFDRTASIETEFSYAPERYFDRTYRSGAVYNRQSEVPTINLIKLHGSLSWRKRSNSIAYDASSVKRLNDDQKKEESDVAAYLEKYFLILPNLKKFHSTIMDRVYYDLLRIFSNSMERENAILVCFGFSFADEHILDITRRALRNPTSQILILSYDHDSVVSFEEKFSKHRNATIITPLDGETIDFSKFNNILNSILPNRE